MTNAPGTLRILYVTPAYKPAYRVGGPVLTLSATAEALVARGHRVCVFTTNSNMDRDLDVPVDRPTMVDGVEVWYFAHSEPVKRLVPFIDYLSKSMGYLYAPMLSRVVKQQVAQFDLVHLQQPFVYPTQAAGRIALRDSKPLFYHQHGVFDPERLKFRGFKKRLYIAAIERPIMRKATMLIALTEAERDSYRALGVDTPCRIIPNGIDTGLHYRTPSSDFSDFYPIGSKQSVLLFLGRLHPIKGADILLEAFLRISSQFPDAVLVLAGPDEYGLELQFRQRVLTAGLADRVFFPGMVSGSLKLNLLARADVFCLPSVAEGFSMAILEAMASGTPVMISPGCHFPEVQAHSAGWIIDRDVDRWADALASALREPDKLLDMGRSALRLVSSRYTWAAVTTQLEDAYEEGIARHRIAKR